MMERSQGRGIWWGIILIVIGVLWYLHETSGFLSGVRLGDAAEILVGLYMLYVWASSRHAIGVASPWLLGFGAALALDGILDYAGMDFRFLPVALILVGAGFLFNRQARRAAT